MKNKEVILEIMPEVTWCGRRWRHQLERLVRGVEAELLIACPFIQLREARFLSTALGAVEADVRVLTDIRMDSIVNGSLDVDALLLLAAFSPKSGVATLPGLHAKVFVADCKRAIITSGNLTRSGLDHNYEYGAVVSGKKMVGRVRKDVERFARGGTVVGDEALREIARLARPLIEKSKPETFGSKEAALNRAVAEAQVGPRSANAVFGDAICRVLADRVPRTTRRLNEEIRRLLPDLCHDALHLTINGKSYGKKWKHQVRNAQVTLKKKGRILYDETARRWLLA